MGYRTSGTSGLRASGLFLAAMTFGEQGGAGAPPSERRRIRGAHADAGGNSADTAINYRDGASEEILGELLAGRRDRFMLAYPPDRRALQIGGPACDPPVVSSYSP